MINNTNDYISREELVTDAYRVGVNTGYRKGFEAGRKSLFEDIKKMFGVDDDSFLPPFRGTEGEDDYE